ncbi:hypothetical protein CEXT_92031 [Caerostris extrusa]|uniref:Uncharacterized protein n=1 Tax=Caerostris extrusa TaxID=172846 RepID=A0AAV4MHH2_CAEEX|nr:hypothetical protein CEXT_92031 [Caerostris extrusa]
MQQDDLKLLSFIAFKSSLCFYHYLPIPGLAAFWEIWLTFQLPLSLLLGHLADHAGCHKLTSILPGLTSHQRYAWYTQTWLQELRALTLQRNVKLHQIPDSIKAQKMDDLANEHSIRDWIAEVNFALPGVTNFLSQFIPPIESYCNSLDAANLLLNGGKHSNF